jgi:hypothetical protein
MEFSASKQLPEKRPSQHEPFTHSPKYGQSSGHCIQPVSHIEYTPSHNKACMPIFAGKEKAFASRIRSRGYYPLTIVDPACPTDTLAREPGGRPQSRPERVTQSRSRSFVRHRLKSRKFSAAHRGPCLCSNRSKQAAIARTRPRGKKTSGS